MDTPGDFEQGVVFMKKCVPGRFGERSWLALEETLAGSRGVMAGSRSGPGAGRGSSRVGAPEWSWRRSWSLVRPGPFGSGLGSELVLTTSFENKVTYVYLF